MDSEDYNKLNGMLTRLIADLSSPKNIVATHFENFDRISRENDHLVFAETERQDSDSSSVAGHTGY